MQVQKSIQKDKEYAEMLANKAVQAELKELEDKQKQMDDSFSIKVMEMKNILEKQRNEEIEIFQKKHKITFNDMKCRHSSEKKQLVKSKNSSMAISQAFTSKHTTGGKSLIK